MAKREEMVSVNGGVVTRGRNCIGFGGMYIFLFLTFFLSTISSVSAQTKVGVVCADSKGKVVVRSKCRSGETKLTLAALSSKGEAGVTGATGATGSSGYQIVSTTLPSESIQTEGVEYIQACPAGKTTIGGGCYANSPYVINHRSYPFDGTPREWRCGFANKSESGTVSSTIVVYAICVNE